MNNEAPMKNLDPRTQYVPEKYSSLAADLMATTKQNKEYWNSVQVALPPSSRIAFEELRQAVVFVPLILVVIVFICIGKIAAAFAFLIALFAMRNLHLNVQRAIERKWNEWLHRDQGRYAFTQFMCKEFNLRPEDVTLDLVHRMCSHFMLLTKARKRSEMEKSGSPRILREGSYDIAPKLMDDKQALGTQWAEKYEPIVNYDWQNTPDDNFFLKVNPMTGLTMMDDCLDIHGNTFGTSNMDDIWNSSSNNVFYVQNDFASSGGDSFIDDVGM